MNATLQQTAADLGKWIAVVQKGEDVVITQNGRAVARLTGMISSPPVGERRKWLDRLAQLRKAGALIKPTPTTEQILDDLRTERF